MLSENVPASKFLQRGELGEAHLDCPHSTLGKDTQRTVNCGTHKKTYGNPGDMRKYGKLRQRWSAGLFYG